MSSLVAASRDTRIRACSPMDPVDGSNLGFNAMPNIHVPVAITHSETSSCNNGSAPTLYGAGLPQKRGIKIVMATHDLGQARRLGDDIVFMVRGRVRERAPAERFFTAPATSEAAAFVRGDLVI